MADLTIQAGTASTLVCVEPSGLGRVGLHLGAAGSRDALVITDSHVGPLYGQRLIESLEPGKWRVQLESVPAGEASKSLSSVHKFYETAARMRLGRDGWVIALGGGMVSDLAGFVAATWMRGISFAIVPTTVESALDAAIGGKTAVNLVSGKNLVGVFHFPKVVVIDPECFGTLEARDVRAGLAESIKHALISSHDALTWHEAYAEAVLRLEEPFLSDLILENVRVKADVVAEDPFERTGRRMVLNFGHTIGHAIETCTEYRLRHGECVALGMLGACRLSRDVAGLDARIVERVAGLLGRFELPVGLQESVAVDEIMNVIQLDKKSRAGQVQWVLLEDVGKPVITPDVPDEAVRTACESLLESAG